MQSPNNQKNKKSTAPFLLIIVDQLKLTLHQASVQAHTTSCPSYSTSASVFYLLGQASRASE